MKKFRVQIKEMLSTTVEVSAANINEAEQLVSDQWKNGDYILDAENFCDVEFCAKPIKREMER